MTKSISGLIALLMVLFLVSCGNKKSGDRENIKDEQSQDQKVEETISGDDIAQMDYLFEAPGEAIQALENISESIEWNDLATFDESIEFANDHVVAFKLGMAITDAMIAIKSQNLTRMLDMNSVAVSLSEQLGLGSVVTANRDSLALLIAQNKWDEVSIIIENLQVSALQKMESAQKAQLVNLIVVGGWFEGMKVITSHLADNYDKDQTMLLNQSGFLNYVIDNLENESIPGELGPKLRESLLKIKAIVGDENPEKTYTKDAVSEINESVVQLIETLN